MRKSTQKGTKVWILLRIAERPIQKEEIIIFPHKIKKEK